MIDDFINPFEFAPLHEIDQLQESFCGTGEGKLKIGHFDLQRALPQNILWAQNLLKIGKLEK